MIVAFSRTKEKELFTKPNRTGMDENWNEHHGELHLRLGEESCLTDPTMIEWLSYAMEELSMPWKKKWTPEQGKSITSILQLLLSQPGPKTKWLYGQGFLVSLGT